MINRPTQADLDEADEYGFGFMYDNPEPKPNMPIPDEMPIGVAILGETDIPGQQYRTHPPDIWYTKSGTWRIGGIYTNDDISDER